MTPRATSRAPSRAVCSGSPVVVSIKIWPGHRALLPIKQIAQQAGFQTVQYLTRTLGRLTGDTPAALRRRHSGRFRGGFSETT